MGLTSLLNAPLYEGTGASSDTPRYMPVAINGRQYTIDTAQYRRKTVDLLRGAADQSAEPGEGSLNTRGLWRRNQSDWRSGAGQDYFDDEDSDRSRFNRSKGVDVWDRRSLSLLHDTALKTASANTNGLVLVVGSYFYWADGSNLKWSQDLTPGSPTFTSIAAGGTITAICTDGAYVYVARSGALLQRSAVGSGTMAAWSVALQPTFVFYANGRLLGSVGARLAELDSNGKVSTDAAPTANLLDYTHRNASFAWRAGVSAPNGIYVGGAINGVTELYFIGLSESLVGALATPAPTTTLPVPETINTMIYYGGALMLGTDKGFRVATIGANDALVFGPLVEVTNGVGAFDAQGQYVWWSWSNYDLTSTGLGRADLARFTQPLVPAYASDLMATVTGIVTGVGTHAGRRYFVVAGSGLWGETTNLVASGELVTGWITWSAHERKVVVSADVRHDPLDGTVAMSVDYDAEPATGGTNVGAGTSQTANSFGPAAPFDVGRQLGERVQLHLVLARSASDTTAGPVVHRWTLRALPAPVRTDEITLPILMHTRVTTPVGEGAEHSYNVLEEFQYLKSVEAQGAVVSYQEGTTTISAYIDSIEVVPSDWTDDFSFFQSLLVVRLLTVSSAA